METRSHIADTTFCQFLKLNYDIMRYNKLAKRLTKDSSVPFERCMRPLIHPHLWTVLFIGTKSRINNMHITVVPTKSESDILFCLQLLSKTLTCTLHLS